MSDTTIEPLPHGDGTLGNSQGPADHRATVTDVLDGRVGAAALQAALRRSLRLAALLVPADGGRP